jgi:ElaB/YqjD/DUF883 family membrane-anchored ribosome-binding protein
MNGRATSELNDATEQLLQDLKEVVEDGEELLRAGANELNDRGQAVRERLSAALDRARETGRKLQERTVAGAKATDRVIRDNPYQTLAIAFGVGMLTAVLLNRK